MILAAVVKWVAGRRVDNYNLQAAYPISYAVGYEVSYKNHYYLIPDLMKIVDSKMYQDKAYKKKNQKRRGTADISVSECVPGTFPGCGRIYQTTAGTDRKISDRDAGGACGVSEKGRISCDTGDSIERYP